MSDIMRLTVISLAMVLVGCGEGQTGIFRSTLTVAPTAAVSMQIVPTTLPLTTVVAVGCPTPKAVALTTSFELLVIPSQQSDVRVDSVTFRLINGESVGGPSITYPSTQLTQMFGTTVVSHARVFVFRPDFGCHVGRPRSMAADVILIDGAGNPQPQAASAVFQ